MSAHLTSQETQKAKVLSDSKGNLEKEKIADKYKLRTYI